MSKPSFTYYYVQSQKEGELPYNVEEKEYFRKFLDREKAQELLEAEKKAAPNVKFRVVKCTETYDADNWV